MPLTTLGSSCLQRHPCWITAGLCSSPQPLSSTVSLTQGALWLFPLSVHHPLSFIFWFPPPVFLQLLCILSCCSLSRLCSACSVKCSWAQGVFLLCFSIEQKSH